MKYTELHLHTYYSLLDGLNSPAEYMTRASELGMTHMAITDHGVLSGHREFQKAAKEAGITPILGCEMYISPTDRFDRRAVKKRDDNTQAYNHLIVLAQNENGLNNLNKLSEIAWTEGFYSKPRIDMEVLEEYNEGLIVLSGCLNGLIAKAIANEQHALADSYTREFKGIFGDRFFMEIQSHNGRVINDGLFGLAEKHEVLPVMTSDCHFAREEDLWLEEAMLILATNPKHNKEFDYSKAQKMEMLERFNYAYPERTMSFQDFDLWLHSAEEHINSSNWPVDSTWDHSRVEQAVANTMVVANMIGDYPYHEALDLLPQPKTGDADSLLEKKAWAGLKNLGLDKDSVYVDRLKEELDVIKSKGFSSYFLIEGNAISWAKSKGIKIGPGRGSGAGSLLNYCLGITSVDPIEHNLLFFRFINPERNDFPDIDTDVEDRRRSEVKDYLRRQYKHVASIATFGTFQGKNSVRDASRVFMVPLGDVNRALKGADWPAQMDWFAMWEATDKGKEFKKKYPEVVNLAKFMHGRIRTQGMHAGGIVVSKEPISNYAPMQSAKDNSDESGSRIPLVAYDMKVAEEIGFVKFDWLGLKALTIISDTLEMIKQRHGEDIDLDALSLDDDNVYKNLSEGWT
jgi:DNA polymerase-3 subunit alpha